ncbi:MAG: DUF5696 domain-containing protein, partial [Firmicutes bacterium]|nr:DUF5696 domain-containing protein [Bacillota bacterium]
MVKLSRFALVAMLSMQTVWFAALADTPKYLSSNANGDNFTFIDNMLLESSRYTQTDTVDAGVLNDYHDTYTLHYTEAELASMGFTAMLEDDNLKVYFEKNSFSVIVVNKDSGYQWSSRPEFQGFSGTREDNTAARNLMNSGLWVDYVLKAKVSTSNITTSSLYTLAETKYQTDGSYHSENPDQTRPYLLTAGSYNEAKVSTAITSTSSESFTVAVSLTTLGANLDVSVSLVNGALDVTVINDSITETSDTYQLTDLTLFPYLGAAREDKMPGYIVIPDGVGALVRTNKYYNTYFQSDFYGSDLGYDKYTIPQLSVPIYGIVHEVGGNGYYANILQGSENATLISTFWGKSTHYQRIASRFNLRQIYRNIINQAGDGYDAVTDDIIDSNYQVRYSFLSGADSSYVGIAKDYRDYLMDQAILTPREKTHNDVIPISLSYILTEREPAFIGTAKVTMTTPNQVKDAYLNFDLNGLKNQQITMLGWSKDGFVNRAPYQFNVSQRSDFTELARRIVRDGNSIYINDNYVYSTDLSTRVSFNRDVARNLSKLKITSGSNDLSNDSRQYYHLYPSSSLKMATDDINDMKNLDVSGMALSTMGDTLFSYYNNAIYSRSDSIAKYQQIAGLYNSLTLSRPSAYLFSYIDGYMNLPITNSQFDYYTDLVPLIPIILKGSLSY